MDSFERLGKTIYLIVNADHGLEGSIALNPDELPNASPAWAAIGCELREWIPQIGDRVRFCVAGGGTGTVIEVPTNVNHAVKVEFDDGDWRIVNTFMFDPISVFGLDGEIATA